MDPLRLFIPLTKVDEEQRLVYGVLAEEAVDKSGEVMDYARSKPHFKAWSDTFKQITKGKSAGNLRRMHQNAVAGHLTAMLLNDDAKRVEVVAKVTDDADWQKVKDGDYTGFSVGGRYVDRWEDPALKVTRYEAEPAEASLVDNPCMRGATFTAIKAGGATELRKFKGPEKIVWTPALLKSEIEAGRITKTAGDDGHIGHFGAGVYERTCEDLNSGRAEIQTGGVIFFKVAAREDTKPAEGEAKYGDVAFADEKNKKYPIDTAAHVRAAWNYINKEKNAAKYGAKDLATIKRKIISAWKRLVDKEGPPSAQKDGGGGDGDVTMSAKAAKHLRGDGVNLLAAGEQLVPLLAGYRSAGAEAGTAEALGLRKWQDGLYHLQTLAGILASLDSLLECVEREEFNEGDLSSPIPAALKQCIQMLGDALVAMCQEETSELYGEEATLMTAAAQVEDLKKIVKDEQDAFAATLTKGLNESVEKIITGALAPLGTQVTKVEGSLKAVEDTAKALDERLAKLERLPAPVGRPVNPAEKVTGGSPAAAQAAEAVTVAGLEKAVELAEQMEGIDDATRQKLRLALATASIMKPQN